MATIRRATGINDFLDILNDTYLFQNRKEARYALEAVSCALRNWMLAMSEGVPVHTMRRLILPGVGTFRIGWREYRDNRYPPRLVFQFSPTRKVKKIIEEQNKRSLEAWKADNGNTPNRVG